jgi:hypothetical protein
MKAINQAGRHGCFQKIRSRILPLQQQADLAIRLFWLGLANPDAESSALTPDHAKLRGLKPSAQAIDQVRAPQDYFRRFYRRNNLLNFVEICA